MRYLPLTKQDREDMLTRVNVKHIDDLFANVPKDKLLKSAPNLPLHKSEQAVERYMNALANQTSRHLPCPSLWVRVHISITSLQPSII